MTPRAVLAVCVDCCQIVCWYLYAASLRDSLEIGAKLTATRETEYDRNGYHTLELFYRRTSHGTDALLIVMTFAKKKKKKHDAVIFCARATLNNSASRQLRNVGCIFRVLHNKSVHYRVADNDSLVSCHSVYASLTWRNKICWRRLGVDKVSIPTEQDIQAAWKL